MKHLNTYITEYIVKKKLDKPIDSENHYDYFPKTKEELAANIKELFDKGETNLNCIDTSAITDMSYLFGTFNNIKNISFNVSNWNVINVTNMSYMFYDCKNFDCDLISWDVSNVTNMSHMFQNCENFTGEGLDKWDVINVKNMACMCYKCKKLDCDLSNWNVSNVTNMSYTFKICYEFKGNGLENWNVSNVENMVGMFYSCKKLNCDLSKWNVSKVKNKRSMFYDCNSLKNIPSWKS